MTQSSFSTSSASGDTTTSSSTGNIELNRILLYLSVYQIMQWFPSTFLEPPTLHPLHVSFVWHTNSGLWVCTTELMSSIRCVWWRWHWMYPNCPLYLHSARFEGTAILSGVSNHSGCSRMHSFNPTMHCKNECTTDVHSTARESP